MTKPREVADDIADKIANHYQQDFPDVRRCLKRMRTSERKGVFHSFVCDLLKMFVVASRQIECCSIWVFHLSLKLPGRSTCLAICEPAFMPWASAPRKRFLLCKNMRNFWGEQQPI